MKIEDQFRVDVPIEEAWRVMLDVERIAPCMPGAQLQEIEGDEYRGVVKVKVGPITAQYKGAARIIEADEATRRIVLKGEGRDTRGQGNASATVTVLLAADGTGSIAPLVAFNSAANCVRLAIPFNTPAAKIIPAWPTP